MTGEELTTLLLRHGLEVASARPQVNARTGMPHFLVEVIDVAAMHAPDPQQIPNNVEIAVRRRESTRYNYLGASSPIGYSDEWQTVAHIRGTGRDVLTSMPLTPSQLRLRRAAGTNPVQEYAVPLWLGPSIPVRTTPRNFGPQRGVQYHFWFPNGRGASVVTDWSQGGWEILELRGRNIDDSEHTDEPVRGCSVVEIESRLATIAAQPRREPTCISQDALFQRLADAFDMLPAQFDDAAFHWFTDAELRTLNKQPATPPWQRLDFADLVLDEATTPSQVAQQLPANVFLQLGDVTTTGLWGGREDEVFVAEAPARVSATAQLQGFRADLWRRMCLHFMGSAREEGKLTHLDLVNENGVGFCFNDTAQPGRRGHEWVWIDQDALHSAPEIPRQADILARWTVYQQLKLLYDVVDGAAGATSAAMPEDVIEMWASREQSLQLRDNWSLERDDNEIVATRPRTIRIRPGDQYNGQSLRNFAAILDVVAEARVAAATTPTQQPAQQPQRWTAESIREHMHSLGLGVVGLGLPGTVERGWVLDVWCEPGFRDFQAVAATLPRNIETWFYVGRECVGQRFVGRVDAEYHGNFIVAADSVSTYEQVKSRQRLTRTVEQAFATFSGDDLVDAIAQTAQHLASQPRRLDYDGLVALLRRHLGDDAHVTTIRSGASDGTHFDVTVTSTPGGGRSIGANELPQNVTIELRGQRLRGCSRQIFDPSRRDSVAKAPPPPTYFDADGDTVTAPDKAPPWLHQMATETRASKVDWRRDNNSVTITFLLPYGHKLGQQQILHVLKQLKSPTGTRVTWTNAPAPRVPVCLVRAIRDRRDLAVLTPSPQEQAITQEWCQLPSNFWRDIVVEIIKLGCVGLSDEAAAERAYYYHVLASEVQQQVKAGEAEHYAAAKAATSAWCEQFRTRAALLEVDDGAVATTQPTRYTHRTKVAVTPQQVRKFRDAWESKMCAQSATECAAAALMATGKVESDKSASKQPDALAVHILTAWCTCLDDKTAATLTSHYHEFATLEDCDRFCADFVAKLQAPLETDPRSSQEDAQAARRAAQRADLASLQAELRKERLAQFRRAADEVAQEELSRFDLLELDGAEEPAKSIAQWESARMQQRKVKPAERATAGVPTFTPPPPQHVDVPTPPHNGVEYVDATYVPEELREMVKWAGVAAAVGEAGRRGKMEN